MHSLPNIEPLEARIAPATFISAYEVHYVDADGDAVTVHASRPIFTPALTGFHFSPSGVGEALGLLALDPGASGVNLSISAEPASGGDGTVAVGSIEASVALGSVSVEGALGRIIAGKVAPGTAALQRLTVGSLGNVPGAPSESFLLASGGAIFVAGDIFHGSLSVQGSLVSLKVGGSIVGGDDLLDGSVRVSGRLFRVQVGDSIVGGAGPSSASFLAGSLTDLQVAGDIVGGGGNGSATIEIKAGTTQLALGGSLIGGGGRESGAIFAQVLLDARIHGSILGGGGDGSGQLSARSIAAVSVAGDISGGTATSDSAARHHGSGMIFTDGALGSVSIAGSVIGGSGSTSGAVISSARLSQIEIHGSVLGGSGPRSGIIRAQGDFGTVIIHGAVTGAGGSESASIRAGEVALSPGSYFDKSIHRLEIDGNLQGGGGLASGLVDAGRNIGSFDIGGSIIGGDGDSAGAIGSRTMGSGHVGGDVRGGDGGYSGRIGSGKSLSLIIDGSLLGGAGFVSASLQFERIAQLSIGGDVAGGGGFDSAGISASLGLGTLEIGGSLIASDSLSSARIDGPVIGAVHIHGSIRNVLTTYFTDFRGADISGGFLVGRIGSLAVDGGIFARESADAKTPITSYAVLASGKVGKLTVGGGLAGTASNRIGIAAGALQLQGSGVYGNEPAPAAAGFGNIEIDGSVRFAEINAGNAQTEFNTLYYRFNPDARIASIVVHGSWTASTLTAGVSPGADGQYGTRDDTTSAIERPAPTAALSTIGRVVIGGRVLGTDAPGDQFAFQAQHIGFASINGRALPLRPALDRIELAPATRDVLLRELGA